jgi:uncharacterized protein (TIGR02594 family)
MKLSKTTRAAILLGSAAFAALALPAVARPGHHSHHRHQAQDEVRTIMFGPSMLQGADRDPRYSAPAIAEAPSARAGRRHTVPAMAAESYAAVPAVAQPGEATQSQAYRRAQSHTNSAFGGFTTDAVVTEARKYIGTNPTGRGSLWCGAFMDMVLKRTGHAGGGNLAWGYSRYGTRVAGPQVGAIAVMHGHVGVVSGIDANGNPIIVSGNHNHTVAEAVYPRARIAAYVMP